MSRLNFHNLRTPLLLTLTAALLLLPTAGAAQTKTLDDLLQEVRAEHRADSELNRKREAEFQAKKNQQQALLNQARQERRRQEARSERLEARHQENERELAQLEDQLADRLGSLGELFGVVRQVAGESRDVIGNSMVSAQFGGADRAELLGKLAGSRDLPSIEDLKGLWYTLQQEITESGKVARFEAPVTLTDGTREQQTVTRIGVFTAIAEGKFLQLDGGRLKLIGRQPGGQLRRAAGNFEAADSGRSEAPLDPSKGTILSLLVEAPDTGETIQQGGGVGYIIIMIGIFGVLVALWRFAVLFQTARRVGEQAGSSTVSRDNPLGRVMKVYADNPETDVESLELKLDEAILREVPKLEAWLSTIKVFSAIAPLLGLLGTVTGMIETFQLITLFGAGDPKLMASGISEALVTTMLGLIVAIPLTFLHAIVQGRSKGITEVLEEQSAGMVARRAEASA